VVDEHQVRIHRSHGSGDLLQFALADQRGRIRTIAMLHEFAGNLRAGRGHEFAKFAQRFFQADAGNTALFFALRCSITRERSTGRYVKIAVRTRAMAKFQGNKERPLRPVSASFDSGRGIGTAGTLPRNKLALHFDGTFAFRRCWCM